MREQHQTLLQCRQGCNELPWVMPADMDEQPMVQRLVLQTGDTAETFEHAENALKTRRSIPLPELRSQADELHSMPGPHSVKRRFSSLISASLHPNVCALTCRFLCLSPPHLPTLPSPPFSLIFHRKTTTHLNPTPNPSARDTKMKNSHPFAKTTPGKNDPLVSA